MALTPLRFMTGTVLARRMVTPGMVRVTLGGEGMAGLRSTGIGDEYIRLFFPDPETGELVLPGLDERGHWAYPEGRAASHSVCYTIRAARPGEIDIDFVVHDSGRASDWALAARPGDLVTLREPHGIYAAPADADWQLFMCDATGLPALGRLVEALPAHVEARAIIEVPDASHEQQFSTQTKLRIAWLHGSGNGLKPSDIPQAVRGISFPVTRKRYVWVAAELRAARAVRGYLRHELGWPGESYSVTGYWTEKKSEWQAGWAGLDPEVTRRIDDLWASDRVPQAGADEVEATLARFGL